MYLALPPAAKNLVLRSDGPAGNVWLNAAQPAQSSWENEQEIRAQDLKASSVQY
jgi:hypothetical protein